MNEQYIQHSLFNPRYECIKTVKELIYDTDSHDEVYFLSLEIMDIYLLKASESGHIIIDPQILAICCFTIASNYLDDEYDMVILNSDFLDTKYMESSNLTKKGLLAAQIQILKLLNWKIPSRTIYTDIVTYCIDNNMDSEKCIPLLRDCMEYTLMLSSFSREQIISGLLSFIYTDYKLVSMVEVHRYLKFIS